MFQWLISFLRKLADFKGFRAPEPADGQPVGDQGDPPAERTGSGKTGVIMTREEALATIALKLAVPPAWLRNLVQFESAWNPQARNKKTGARGLIQFMPKTARALGFADADDLVNKYPDVVSQLLNPVLRYFTELPGNKPPYPTEQSLYMTVFYPDYRNVPPDTVFSNTVRQYNPGIDTVADYVNYVKRQANVKTVVKTGASIGMVLLLAGAAYLIYQHIQSKGGTV